MFSKFYYRETVNKSYGYTGKGVATYPNGDIYDGYFVNGVSKPCPLYIQIIQVREGDEGTYKYFAKPVGEDGAAPENKYTGAWKDN